MVGRSLRPWPALLDVFKIVQKADMVPHIFGVEPQRRNGLSREFESRNPHAWRGRIVMFVCCPLAPINDCIARNSNLPYAISQQRTEIFVPLQHPIKACVRPLDLCSDQNRWCLMEDIKHSVCGVYFRSRALSSYRIKSWQQQQGLVMECITFLETRVYHDLTNSLTAYDVAQWFRQNTLQRSHARRKTKSLWGIPEIVAWICRSHIQQPRHCRNDHLKRSLSERLLNISPKRFVDLLIVYRWNGCSQLLAPHY